MYKVLRAVCAYVILKIDLFYCKVIITWMDLLQV